MRGLQNHFPSHHLSSKGNFTQTSWAPGNSASRGKGQSLLCFLLAVEGNKTGHRYYPKATMRKSSQHQALVKNLTKHDQGCPLEQHLQDEDVGEDFISVLQDGTDGLPLLDVDVLKGAGREAAAAYSAPHEKQATRTSTPHPRSPQQPSHLCWRVISSHLPSLYPLLHMAFLCKKSFLEM